MCGDGRGVDGRELDLDFEAFARRHLAREVRAAHQRVEQAVCESRQHTGLPRASEYDEPSGGARRA